MAEKYLKKVIIDFPDLAGKRLFLSPKLLPVEVECQVNANGSISLYNDSSSSWPSPAKLLQTYDPSIKRASAAKDIFLEPCRKQSLQNLYLRRQSVSIVLSHRSTKIPCVGFMTKSVNGYEPWNNRNQIISDGLVFRSRACYGYIRRGGKKKLCSRCQLAKNSLLEFISSTRRDGYLCNGIRRYPFEQLIKTRKWETERSDVSPVLFVLSRLFSVKCDGKKPKREGIRCDACTKTLVSLRMKNWMNLKKPPKNEENRLRHSKMALLSASDLKQKNAILRLRRKEKSNNLKSALTKATVALRQAERYIPKDPNNRKAAESITRHLDQETAKIRHPVCHWSINDGIECNFEAVSCHRLLSHISVAHLVDQKRQNRNLEPAERQYSCRWKGCSRKKTFRTWKTFWLHLVGHCGSVKDEQRLEILRNFLINSNRSPSGRRYCQTAKDLASAKYASQASWNRSREFTPLYSPSAVTMHKLRIGAGAVETGIQVNTLRAMASIAAHRPNLRHGIIVFDEVYVRPCVTFHSTSRLVYGLADDSRGELAIKLLVFQYISLFSKKRFVLNVAWYACASKAVDANILHWFMDVGHALESHGFHLHGLLCDGDPKNRGLQNTLASADLYGDEKTKDDSGIVHPFSSEIDRFYLFSDPSHIVKKARNSWVNARKSLLIPVSVISQQDHNYNRPDVLWYPIDWKHVLAVFEWQQNELNIGNLVDRPLSKMHVVIGNYEKMNLKTAIDVVSEPIEKVMVVEVPDSEGTRRYMGLFRTFWLAMNQRKTFSGRQGYGRTKKLRDDLEAVDRELTFWQENAPSRDKNFITNECYADTIRVCRAVPGLIDQILNRMPVTGVQRRFSPKLLTQDFLEREFGAMRQSCGGAFNPPVQSAVQALRNRNSKFLNKFKLGSLIA